MLRRTQTLFLFRWYCHCWNYYLVLYLQIKFCCPFLKSKRIEFIEFKVATYLRRRPEAALTLWVYSKKIEIIFKMFWWSKSCFSCSPIQRTIEWDGGNYQCFLIFFKGTSRILLVQRKVWYMYYWFENKENWAVMKLEVTYFSMQSEKKLLLHFWPALNFIFDYKSWVGKCKT